VWRKNHTLLKGIEIAIRKRMRSVSTRYLCVAMLWACSAESPTAKTSSGVQASNLNILSRTECDRSCTDAGGTFAVAQPAEKRCEFQDNSGWWNESFWYRDVIKGVCSDAERAPYADGVVEDAVCWGYDENAPSTENQYSIDFDDSCETCSFAATRIVNTHSLQHRNDARACQAFCQKLGLTYQELRSDASSVYGECRDGAGHGCGGTECVYNTSGPFRFDITQGDDGAFASYIIGKDVFSTASINDIVVSVEGDLHISGLAWKKDSQGRERGIWYRMTLDKTGRWKQAPVLLGEDWPTLDGTNNIDLPFQPVVVDASGNSYAVGSYQTAANIKGGFTLPAPSADGTGLFVVKFDMQGNVVWVKTMLGVQQLEGLALKVDASQNVYVGGVTTGDVTIPGDSRTVRVTGGAESFLAQLNARGDWVWLLSTSGNSASAAAEPWTLDVDSTGVYWGGRCQGDVKFGDREVVGRKTQAGEATPDFCLAKADLDGSRWLWAAASPTPRTVADVGPQGRVALVRSNDRGALAIAGDFLGELDFDNKSYRSTEGSDLLVAQLNANTGEWLWTNVVQGDHNDLVNALSIDDVGRVYLLHSLQDRAVIGRRTLTSQAPAHGDLVLAQLNAHNGNWDKVLQHHTKGEDSGSTLVQGADGILYIGASCGQSRHTFGAEPERGVDIPPSYACVFGLPSSAF